MDRGMAGLQSRMGRKIYVIAVPARRTYKARHAAGRGARLVMITPDGM
jgi:hypothetical protein